jgi:hypothetical protein
MLYAIDFDSARNTIYVTTFLIFPSVAPVFSDWYLPVVSVDIRYNGKAPLDVRQLSKVMQQTLHFFQTDLARAQVYFISIKFWQNLKKSFFPFRQTKQFNRSFNVSPEEHLHITQIRTIKEIQVVLFKGK